jgi:probable H4MPT-linked C1 transfer pathway protein
VPPEAALDNPLPVAASSWHALARFAGRYVPQRAGLVINIGSSTSDIVPLVHGLPTPRGRTDPERLVSGELVYTGVKQSPICAVASRVPWKGFLCPLAQEVSATMWDVYLLLGDLPEEPDRTDTADGRAATRQAAHDRLARSICADRTLVDHEAACTIAKAVAEAQLDALAEAADRVIGTLPERPGGVVLSGGGEFVARRVIERLGLSSRIVSLAEELGPEVCRAATAHAVAVLAAESVLP